MTMRCFAFIATSLDGFIARADGSLDWLPAPDPDEDYGYARFMSRMDALVLGRNTFETVLDFGAWPYDGKRVVVLSRTLSTDDVPAALQDKMTLYRGTLPDLLRQLGTEGHTSLYVDGGKTIQSFLQAGLLDELTLTRIPLLLGSGIPLFGALKQEVRLQHLDNRTYPNGLVQDRYRVLGRDRPPGTCPGDR